MCTYVQGLQRRHSRRWLGWCVVCRVLFVSCFECASPCSHVLSLLVFFFFFLLPPLFVLSFSFSSLLVDLCTCIFWTPPSLSSCRLVKRKHRRCSASCAHASFLCVLFLFLCLSFCLLFLFSRLVRLEIGFALFASHVTTSRARQNDVVMPSWPRVSVTPKRLVLYTYFVNRSMPCL